MRFLGMPSGPFQLSSASCDATTQARKKSTKINFLGPETARWGGVLPREGVVVENFVLSLETLSSLGFEERNLGCPGNFAGMSRTECTKIARFSAAAAAISTAPQRIARFFGAPRCAISSAKKIASEPRFLLRRKWVKMVLAAEFPAIRLSAVKITSERRCAILVHSGPGPLGVFKKFVQKKFVLIFRTLTTGCMQERRLARQATVPTTLQAEFLINPFMRSGDVSMQSICPGCTPVDVFAALRRQKDSSRSCVRIP